MNVEALQVSKEIILCEALIDALTFWVAGYRHVTASYGVEGFTAEHLAAFKTHGTERILIAYDRDAAGEQAAEKLSWQLLAEGIDCYRVQFPKGMDANDYALKVQSASKSLGLVLRKALWLGKGVAPTVPLAEPVSSSHLAASVLAHEEHAAIVDAESPTSIAIREEPALPASPVPPAPASDIAAQVSDSEVVMQLGDRRYRIRGLSRNLGFELLKVNVLVARGEAFYVDTLDLYSARQRSSYLAHAAIEVQVKEDILKTDLGRVLLKLEQLQEQTLAKALQPSAPALPQMSDVERNAALSLLSAPDLIARILNHFEACGLVGEATNNLIGYLAAVSRKLDRPLGVVVQSSSAAGKSSLLDAVLAFVPEEERVKYSAMTGQSLFYMGETHMQHKVLALVEEEGASRASYALKLLQSEGELTIASTGKDPDTGNLVTQAYRVQGPVALLLTTTARDLDEELLNRCLVLTVDESREQTKAIHTLQRNRRTLAGLLAKREREALIHLHQNAQRLLRSLEVLNPYASLLTFPDQTTRLRRDHEKYLTLIDTLALLHQHQREVKTCTRGEQMIEYIEVTLDDIALANSIAHEVLGRSLDELPPQTRRLLKLIDQYVTTECERQQVKRANCRFSRRQLREALRLGDTQLKVHLARLTEMEYLLAHRTRQGGLEYELLYETAGEEDSVRFPGLIDIEALRQAYDAGRSGPDASGSGSGRGALAPQAGAGRNGGSAAEQDHARLSRDLPVAASNTHALKGNGNNTSYSRPAVTAL